MITITVELRTGAVVALAPDKIESFEEHDDNGVACPLIRMQSGAEFVCRPVSAAGDAAGAPQSVLMASAVAQGVQNLIGRLERRQQLVGRG